MDEPGFFNKARVIIVGLGLMGGSLALALKDKVAWLGGIDTSNVVLKQAASLKIFDQLSSHPADLIPHADVLILAAPVRQNIQFLQALPELSTRPLLVLDLGSTKGDILKVMSALPENFDPIGCHPMCGSEKSSILNADVHFFIDARFIITPLVRSSAKARQFAASLAKAIQSMPIILDADVHDQITSQISHFPYLVSAALCLATPAESSLLISTGFKSVTRLAGSSPAMMLDIFMSNPDNILSALSNFKMVLAEFESALQEKDEYRLNQLFEGAQKKYRQLLD